MSLFRISLFWDPLCVSLKVLIAETCNLVRWYMKAIRTFLLWLRVIRPIMGFNMSPFFSWPRSSIFSQITGRNDLKLCMMTHLSTGKDQYLYFSMWGAYVCICLCVFVFLSVCVSVSLCVLPKVLMAETCNLVGCYIYEGNDTFLIITLCYLTNHGVYY